MSDTTIVTTTPQNPLAMLVEAASNPAMDPGKLTALYGIIAQEREVQARAQFFAAMSAVQATGLRVQRDRSNSHTKNTYATLEAICDHLVPIYTEQGLSLSFGEEDCPHGADWVRMTVRIGHVGGHFIMQHCDVPVDGGGMKGGTNKTATQARGSTLTYARRYLTMAAFNLTTSDDPADNDGNATPSDSISPSDAASLRAEIAQDGGNEEAFCKYLKVATLDALAADRLDFARAALATKREQKAKREAAP